MKSGSGDLIGDIGGIFVRLRLGLNGWFKDMETGCASITGWCIVDRLSS